MVEVDEKMTGIGMDEQELQRYKVGPSTTGWSSCFHFRLSALDPYGTHVNRALPNNGQREMSSGTPPCGVMTVANRARSMIPLWFDDGEQQPRRRWRAATTAPLSYRRSRMESHGDPVGPR